jgi:hypothetical protein
METRTRTFEFDFAGPWPEAEGVVTIFDGKNQVIYIGQTDNLSVKMEQIKTDLSNRIHEYGPKIVDIHRITGTEKQVHYNRKWSEYRPPVWDGQVPFRPMVTIIESN